MFQAAIVEDEPDIAFYIEKTLTQKFIESNVSVTFEIFTKGKNFLQSINAHYHYDIVFMDIEMPEIDGITVTKKLRDISEEILVVFISNKDDLVFSSFEVRPFRFIRKSYYDRLYSSLVEDLIHELFRRTCCPLKIVESGTKDIFSFDVHKILYVEAQGKNCCIHTTTESVVIKIRLSDIAQQLAGRNFIKPHRSYLVNCQYISIIYKTDIELSNSVRIPISRGHANKVKEEYLTFTNRRHS